MLYCNYVIKKNIDVVMTYLIRGDLRHHLLLQQTDLEAPSLHQSINLSVYLIRYFFSGDQYESSNSLVRLRDIQSGDEWDEISRRLMRR